MWSMTLYLWGWRFYLVDDGTDLSSSWMAFETVRPAGKVNGSGCDLTLSELCKVGCNLEVSLSLSVVIFDTSDLGLNASHEYLIGDAVRNCGRNILVCEVKHMESESNRTKQAAGLLSIHFTVNVPPT